MPTRISRTVKSSTKGASRTARDGLTIERRRCGSGFSYHGKDGRRIADPRIVKRLTSLAVPPAYADVVYAKDASAPLQAMGREIGSPWQAKHKLAAAAALAVTERSASRPSAG